MSTDDKAGAVIALVCAGWAVIGLLSAYFAGAYDRRR